MSKFVSNRDESVRLFKNPVLEYFSHIHPATPIVVFVPVVTYMMYRAFAAHPMLYVVSMFFVGLMVWSAFEYTLHRWVFHYEPKTAFGKNAHFWIHGIHHDYPRDGTRLVMPLLVSVPLAIFFYSLYTLLFGNIGEALFAGMTIGYVGYDSIHYAIHHFAMKNKVAKFIKDYHLRHHYNDDQTAFGVSNPLWDYVFGTVPDILATKEKDGAGE